MHCISQQYIHSLPLPSRRSGLYFGLGRGGHCEIVRRVDVKGKMIHTLSL